MLDLRRFARLAAAEWVENRRAWAWFLGAGIIVHFVLVLILLSMDRPWTAFHTEAQAGIFIVGLFLTAPIFAGRYFQAMARPGSALVALMRPASTFEKWLLAVLVVGVAYPVAYHLAFFVCNAPATWIAEARFAALPPSEAGEAAILGRRGFDLFHVFAGDVPPRAWMGIGLGLVAMQAFAVTGSLMFQRWPFLKTLLAGFLVLLAGIFATVVLDGDPGTFLGYWEDPAQYDAPAPAIVPIAWVMVPTLLWVAAFLALREREVGR